MTEHNISEIAEKLKSIGECTIFPWHTLCDSEEGLNEFKETLTETDQKYYGDLVLNGYNASIKSHFDPVNRNFFIDIGILIPNKEVNDMNSYEDCANYWNITLESCIRSYMNLLNEFANVEIDDNVDFNNIDNIENVTIH